MNIDEYKALKAKKTRSGKGKSKQSHIRSSNVSDTSDDISSNLMFKSASEVAKRLKNIRVDDCVYLPEAVKVEKGEREGLTITLENGEVIKYLKI